MKIRSFALVVLALAATVLLAFTPTAVPEVALLATTALIMGGAGHPLGSPPDSLSYVNGYVNNRITNYVAPALGAQPDNTLVVVTPEARILGFGFDPSFTFSGIFDGPFDPAVAKGQQNLDACIQGSAACIYNPDASTVAPTPQQPGDSFIVYGYSQSSSIASMEKIHLKEQYPNGGGPKVSFVLTANGNRPNGGILTRGPAGLTVPIIGLTFGSPTPTDTQYQTVDIARQYDGWSDQPTNPLNLLSEVNSIFGQLYLHVNYDDVSLGQAVEQDQVGDTTYYLIPTPILPILLPLDSVPVVGHPLADTLDPFMRVLVEAGYDRTVSPGTYSTFNLLYFPNPVDLVHNLAEAVPTGLDNGIQDVTGDRPLGTVRPGWYGVGGPPVTLDPQTDPQPVSQTDTLLTSSQTTVDPIDKTTPADDPAPGLTPSVPTKLPILTALSNGATRVQAQGEVRKNPLALPGNGSLLLDGVSDPGNAKGSGIPSTAAIGSPLKQITQAVTAAVDKVIKPKPAATDGG